MKNKISIYIVLILIAFQANNITCEAENKIYESEQIHVHVHKNVFLAGESVLFKLYCFNSKNKKLSNLSKVAYLELIDENGNAVAQDQITLQNGMGNGGFKITDQLSTGNYAINAYTHWMNSTSKELTSVTQIFIFNNQNLTKNGNDNLKQLQKETHLVDLKDNNKTILKSDSTNNTEKALIIESTIEDLDRYLKFTISATDNFTPKVGKLQFQIFSRKGKIIDENFELSDNKWEFRIHKKELNLPNYGVCIKNSSGQIITQSVIHLSENTTGLFFENPRINANPNEKIKLNLNINDFSNEANSVFLSASIKLKEPIQTSANIIEYFNTNSDLGASMNTYFEQLSNVSKQNWIAKNTLQSLWTISKSSYSITSSQYPEEEAYVLEGQILNQKTKKSLSDKIVYLSKIGEYADLSTFKTQQDGKFYFHLPLKKGLHDISIQLREKSNEAFSIELNDKYNQVGFAPIGWQKENLSSTQLDFIKRLYENHRIRNIYKQQTYTELQDTCLYRGESNFFGKPFSLTKIENYVRLDSLEEYFHEFISQVKISYRKKKSYMNVYSPEQLKVMQTAPLILFDGLIISDPRIILNKQPSEIDRIEVMPYEYYYGKSHFYGIIHAISKNKNCKIDRVPINTERYYLPLFTSSYSLNENKKNKEKFIPDFRTDLYWEPHITLSKEQNFELEFTTSDVKGEYELTIEGISDDGMPIVLKQSIFIK